MFWTFQCYHSRWAEPVVPLWWQMSAQPPVHVSITSKQEQMNYHSHQSVFISQDGCQCRQSPAVPLLSCHFFSLTSFFHCPFVISLSLVLARPPAPSIPLLPFIPYHAYILSLYLTLSIFLFSAGLFWSSLKCTSQQQEPSPSALSHKPIRLTVSSSR